MPFIFNNPKSLVGKPLAGSGTCVDLIKVYVPGLRGLPTTAWREGASVMDARGAIAPGTAIATFEKGRYPRRSHDNHAALVVLVMGSGIWVVDQWAHDPKNPLIKKRLIRVPAPGEQRNADGSFKKPSDNALAYSVIER